MKAIFITIFILLVFSCNHNTNKQQSRIASYENIADTCDSEINSIDVLYYNYIFVNSRARNWDDLQLRIPSFIDDNQKDGILDAKIEDCNILKEINKELKQVKLYKSQYKIDIRIAATVNYKDGSKKRISIGGIYSTDIAVDDLILDSSGNKLKYLIKNNIGFYAWMGEKMLSEMNELRDTIYVQRPFVESAYYKLYINKKGN
ncbi:hypothetical protein [Dysgonomonas mossii]|uniref:hypothetical protein n=1 Tax=Dysgonomonas mossii TaxID=163665 RepID=UPI0039953830